MTTVTATARYGVDPSCRTHAVVRPRRPAPTRSTGRGGRRAAALALLVAVVITAVLAVASSGAATAAGPPGERAADGPALVVAPGDTVWDLVLPHTPAGTTTNVWVAAVLAHNGITGGHVEPGDVLRLPATP